MWHFSIDGADKNVNIPPSVVHQQTRRTINDPNASGYDGACLGGHIKDRLLLVGHVLPVDAGFVFVVIVVFSFLQICNNIGSQVKVINKLTT